MGTIEEKQENATSIVMTQAKKQDEQVEVEEDKEKEPKEKARDEKENKEMEKEHNDKKAQVDSSQNATRIMTQANREENLLKVKENDTDKHKGTETIEEKQENATSIVIT